MDSNSTNYRSFYPICERRIRLSTAIIMLEKDKSRRLENSRHTHFRIFQNLFKNRS